MRFRVLVTVVCATVASAVLFARAAPHQDRDVSKLLAAARQGLGGEAALSAVTTFTATGSFTRDLATLNPAGLGLGLRAAAGGRAGRDTQLPPDSTQTTPLPSDINIPPTISYALEISCALPDKFVRTIRDNGGTEPGGRRRAPSTRFQGFNGDDPIDSTIMPRPMPDTVADALPSRTVSGVVDANKHIFVQFVLPLFLASFPSQPLEFTDAGRTPTGLQDIIYVSRRETDRAEDHLVFKLLLDAKTHLPFALTWSAPYVVQRDLALDPHGLIIGDRKDVLQVPSPEFEWRMVITDYKKTDGLNWPHRFTTVVKGRTLIDEKISRYTINPKIDPKAFKPTK